MEVKMRECDFEAKETEHKEDNVHTIVFTVGTVLLMLCLKRFPVEQWRAWVFLILNLILLAILFLSMRPRCWVRSSETESKGNVEEVENDETERRRHCGCSQEIEEGKECDRKQCRTSTSVHVQNEREEEEEEEEMEEVEEEVPRLSKEELNERAEAFIAMFRQHLVSDVKRAENFRFRKTANLTPKRLECLVEA